MTISDRVREIFAATVPADNAGCALSIVRAGQEPETLVGGMANLEHMVPVGPQTRFHVASVSKQFAAYTVALLAEDGLVDLDAPVQKYLDFVPFPDVTVRQLIHHTSGLRDQWELVIDSGRRMEDVITTQDVIELVRRQRELNFVPGTYQMYCNTGYTLLALLAEQVSERPLQELCSDRIFAPLGMTATRWNVDHHDVVPDRADSYVLAGDRQLRVQLSYSTVGATSLLTTAGDLARWARHLMTPDVLRLVDTPAVLADGTPTVYAFGLMLAERGGHRIVHHAGGDAAFRAHLEIAPDAGVGVVACSNNGTLAVVDLVRNVLDALLGIEKDAASGWRPTEAELEPLAGLYRDDVSGQTFRLTVADETAYLVTLMGPVAMVPLDKGTFTLPGDLTVQADGDAITMSSGTSPARVARRANESMLVVDERFVGTWWSDELQTAFTIAVAGDSLIASRPTWGTVTLLPTVPGGYHLPIPQGLMSTLADIRIRDGADDELFLSGSRNWNVRFRKVGP